MEEPVDTTPKATAIFWVDKDNTKPQSQRIKSYLQYRLEEFRVKKVMLDSGFVKPGVQYVQLRYLPGKLDAHHRWSYLCSFFPFFSTITGSSLP